MYSAVFLAQKIMTDAQRRRHRKDKTQQGTKRKDKTKVWKVCGHFKLKRNLIDEKRLYRERGTPVRCCKRTLNRCNYLLETLRFGLSAELHLNYTASIQRTTTERVCFVQSTSSASVRHIGGSHLLSEHLCTNLTVTNSRIYYQEKKR